MNAQGSLQTARRLERLAALATLALALAGSQSGCCCFECIEHCTAPVKIIPPHSALKPRNPPCSHVDPMCYGYHPTCWRSWPAECDNARDCLEWCQQDAIPLPAKGESTLPLAPMPDRPQAPAPAPAAPKAEPQGEGEQEEALEESPEFHVRPVSEHVFLPPVITVEEFVEAARELPRDTESPVEEPEAYSSRLVR